MLCRTCLLLLTISSLLASAAVHGDTIGPGFGVSGYSVTATASPALDVQSNTNTNPGGTVSAFFDAGSGGPVTAIASTFEADNAYQGQVYTDIGSGFGATSSTGSALIDFRLSGAPTSSTTQVTLTFNESAQISASPPTPNGVATFDITSDFQLAGQSSDETKVNAVGLYKNAQLSGSGSLAGFIDSLDSSKFDLFGTSQVTAAVSGNDNIVFRMTNEINVEVVRTGGLGLYNVALTGVSLTNSAGATVTLTPESLDPVPLPDCLSELACGLLILFATRFCRVKSSSFE